jgi:hypothetical protein
VTCGPIISATHVFVARFRSLSVFHWPGHRDRGDRVQGHPGPSDNGGGTGPVWCTSIRVFVGNATDAFGGIVRVFPAALFISTALPASASTSVYVVPVCALTSATCSCASLEGRLDSVQERSGVVVRGSVRDERPCECVLRHKEVSSP